MSFLTPDLLRKAMEDVPLSIKDKLKEGPLPRRYDCGICVAFNGEFEGYGITIDTDDPLYRVWVYHEIPKKDFVHVDQNYDGKGANEIYSRCIATYRIAGWKGMADEPNA